MRLTKILLTILLLPAFAVAAPAGDSTDVTAVTAPYFTDLDSARAAADGRPLVVDFYTGW